MGCDRRRRAAATAPTLDRATLDSALRAVGEFADLKSPATVGHSTGVAELAAAAGMAGLPPVRRAGWVHDIGRVGSAPWCGRSPGRSRTPSASRCRCTPTSAPPGAAAGSGRGRVTLRRARRAAGRRRRRGRSLRQIAAALVIAPKTADAHVQHVYAKIGVSTRAAATMFAMQHNLVP